MNDMQSTYHYYTKNQGGLLDNQETILLSAFQVEDMTRTPIHHIIIIK